MIGTRTTHADYSANCAAIAQQQGRVGGRHVQVMRRGAVLCGQVVELSVFERGQERQWFKVQTAIGTIWTPAPQVRLCDLASDGRCICVAVPEDAL